MNIKTIQTNLINLIENSMNVFFFLSNYQKGILLMIFHFVLISSGILLFFISSNKKIKYTILLLSILVFISQILFRGCILTRVERKLTNADLTVVDPILYVANINKTKEARYTLTLGLSIGFMVSMVLSIL
jgi:hypothetical protein